MGISDVLFGGLGKSTNPSDYAVKNPMAAQINAQMYGQSVDPTQQAQFRQMQMQQAQQLQGIANGTQQGAGELAAQRQVQNALAAQQAMARMARGGNSALAMRGAANNASSIGLAGAGQAQQAALQDQQMAQSQLMNSLQQGRGQDLSMQGLYNDRYGQNLGALTGLNGQDLTAQGNAMQQTLGQQGVAGGLLNTVGSTLGAILSDETLKTDIRDASNDIDAMLDGLVAKTYRYKDEARHGRGERAGIMAQDLQKTRTGAALIVNTRDGLAVDAGKAVSAALAATARLNERMRKLEAARG